MIEINGFPQKAEKNTEQLVIDLADEMSISVRLYDIKASHRLSKREKLRNFMNQGNSEWGLNSLFLLCALHVYQSKSLNHYKHVGLTLVNFGFENASIRIIHTLLS